MAMDTMQKRMSAMNPMCAWRGPMVDATEAGFSAGNRAAADYAYSGLITPPAPGTAAPAAGFIANMGRMMVRTGG